MDFDLYLVRHGQTDWNAEGRLQGQADTAINAVGHAQARRNGRRLAALIDDPGSYRFVSSSMRRARQTMEIMRVAMGLPPSGYDVEPRLIEVHFGDWQGSTFAELELTDPGCRERREADKWAFLPPGEYAESYAMLAVRVRPWLEGLYRPTVCVAHGGVLRAVFVLTGTLTPAEAAMLEIRQDAILRLRGGRLEWL